MATIQNILIVGGTHGNELSGTTYVQRNMKANSSALDLVSVPSDINLNWLIANPYAMQMRNRYIEEDLNRQFTANKLSASQTLSLEHARAQEINQQFGPKGNAKTDLVIDIHNTTSNMGPTLIVLESDKWHSRLARYVKSKMPEAVILIEDECPYYDHKYLCTLGKKGVMIEVGPQPQGALTAKAYHQTDKMCCAIIEYCVLYNEGRLPELTETEAYRLLNEVHYPADMNGNICAMIHPDLHGKDFQALSKGMKTFIDFEGNELMHQSDDTVYPHFIGEAAYYHLGIAYATASKCHF